MGNDEELKKEGKEKHCSWLRRWARRLAEKFKGAAPIVAEAVKISIIITELVLLIAGAASCPPLAIAAAPIGVTIGAVVATKRFKSISAEIQKLDSTKDTIADGCEDFSAALSRG